MNFFLATTKIFLLPHRVTRIEMYLPPTSNKLNSTFLVYYVKTGESTSTCKHFLKKRTNAKITISQQLTIKQTFCGCSSASTSSQGLSSSRPLERKDERPWERGFFYMSLVGIKLFVQSVCFRIVFSYTVLLCLQKYLFNNLLL